MKFILAAEGLSAMLRHLEANGSIQGCVIAPGAPPVSHLFFADDSLLFFRASVDESLCIKHCLEVYEHASGQSINLLKSSITFSSNVRDGPRTTIRSIFGITSSDSHDRYLGLPSLVGRNKSKIFRYISDRVWERINSWSFKFLSRAGKHVLLKSVIQSLPSYSMQVFLIPASICDRVQKTMNSFWWGCPQESNSGIRWSSWDKMCISKGSGGLGFRKLREFNLSLLAKRGWEIITNPSTLAAKVLKARYFPDGDFLSAELGPNPSYLWSSLLAAKPLLQSGCRFRVGNGESLNIWRSPWLPSVDSGLIATAPIPGLEEAKVCDLFKEDRSGWDENLLGLFELRDCDLIRRIPISLNPNDDKLFWLLDSRGIYSVRSGYKALSNHLVSSYGRPFQWWFRLWNAAVPPKFKEFCWRAASGFLPTASSLIKKGVSIDSKCTLCDSGSEDSTHLLLSCEFAVSVWNLANLHINLQFSSMSDWFAYLFNSRDQGVVGYALSIIWHIWNARNKKLWQGIVLSPEAIIHAALSFLSAWQAVQSSQLRVGVVPSTSPSRWIAPPFNWFKCNFDAARFVVSNSSGFGCVVRGASGNFIAAHAAAAPGLHDAFLAEVLGFRGTLTWIRSLHIDNIIFESDSQLLVRAFHTNSLDNSYAGAVLDDCKVLLASFNSFLVNHVLRSANQVAHVLARESGSRSDPRCWVDVPPSCISSFLLSEL